MDTNVTGGPVEEDEFSIDSNHLCWIYENDADELGIVQPFLMTHLRRGRRCVLVLPHAAAQTVFDRCRKDNLDLDHYLDSRQLIVIEPEDFFFAGGPFDIDLILHRMHATRKQALDEGWQGIAVVSDPSTLLDRADDRDWLALEFRVDFECMNHCSMLCLYDARLASGALITQVIKAHPVIGLGRGLARNPFYGPQANETV